MNSRRLYLDCPGARIETLVEEPACEPHGLALIAHPHPLHGGSLDNKVAWALARAALACGLVAVRPNFRGVGGSNGTHDQGIGESEDLLTIADLLGTQYGGLPWTLFGFSFGAYVQSLVARRLAARRLILVAPPVSRYPFDALPVSCAILHGAEDELFPLSEVRAYAQRHGLPMRVIAGAGHFFHGRLKALQAEAEDLCRNGSDWSLPN